VYPIHVHCSLIDGVIWQYAFLQNSIHAEVFIPAKYIARYYALCDFFGVENHNFGDGIVGNGANNRKTRSLKLTVLHGLNVPEVEWNGIAGQAVAAMITLFERVS